MNSKNKNNNHHHHTHGVLGFNRVDGRLSPRNRIQSSTSSSSSSSSFSTTQIHSSMMIQDDEENQALLNTQDNITSIPFTPTNPSLTLIPSAHENLNKTTIRRRSDRGITWALYISYLTLMGSKIALPSTLSMLTAPSSISGLSMPILKKSTSISSSSPSQFMAHILSFSTLSLALGKAITGPIIDRLGGVRSLQIALTLLTCLLLNISFTSSFTTFQYSWMMIDFIFASGWAACLNAISHTTMTSSTTTNNNKNKKNNTTTIDTDNTIWTLKIRGLATSARLGNALFFSIFSIILQYTPTFILSLQERKENNYYWLKMWIPNIGQCWRLVFFVSALIQSIPLILLYIFGKKKQITPPTINTFVDNRNDHEENKYIILPSTTSHHQSSSLSLSSSSLGISPLQCLQKELSTITFWCQLINRSVLILIASFLLFVPSYMTHCFHLSTSSASRVGTVYALGCLLALSPTMNQWMSQKIRQSIIFAWKKKNYYYYSSSTTSSTHYNNNKWTSILMMNLFLGCLLSCCLIQLGHVSQIISVPYWLGIISMFLWGFSFAIPFYIPSSVYALARGGTTASATIADAFDFVGFLLLAWFNGYVAALPLSNPSSWIGPFQLLTACTLVSMVSLSTALYLEKDT